MPCLKKNARFLAALLPVMGNHAPGKIYIAISRHALIM